ncbi:MAG TPA: hypothetical protein VI756_30100 [Blastocatellia bacterium]
MVIIPKGLRTVLLAGSVSGTLDLTAAFVKAGIAGIAPARVLRFIASGMVGVRSFNGGAATAALGVAAHFCIAFSASTVFYLASRRFDFLTDRPLVSGALYAIGVYLFMNLVVVPLSATPPRPLSTADIIIGILILIVCIGIPNSLIVRWSMNKDSGSARVTQSTLNPPTARSTSSPV